MGKRHRTLKDNIFKKSKYIEVVNNQVGCKDFAKEYKEQYNFMLDTFSSLILLHNCFASDSNLSLADKVANALDIMEEYIYVNFNESDKKKYSVRFIQSICEKHSTYIYRRINDWYECLEHLTSKDISTSNIVKNVISEIEKEIKRLENVRFDDMVNENIDYKKNKNNDYKIFLSKFDTLYADREQFLKTYKHDFSDLYGIDLTDDELDNMTMLYTLLAKGNNGIVNTLFDNEIKDYGLSEKSFPMDYFNAYLDTLHIKPKYFNKLEAQQFMFYFLINYEECLKPKGFTINEVINNYDNFYFLITMERLQKDPAFKPTNDITNGLYKSLKNIYELINKEFANNDELIQNYTKAYEEITKVINRHLKYFIRLS